MAGGVPANPPLNRSQNRCCRGSQNAWPVRKATRAFPSKSLGRALLLASHWRPRHVQESGKQTICVVICFLWIVFWQHEKSKKRQTTTSTVDVVAHGTLLPKAACAPQHSPQLTTLAISRTNLLRRSGIRCGTQDQRAAGRNGLPLLGVHDGEKRLDSTHASVLTDPRIGRSEAIDPPSTDTRLCGAICCAPGGRLAHDLHYRSAGYLD